MGVEVGELQTELFSRRRVTRDASAANIELEVRRDGAASPCSVHEHAMMP